MRIVSLIDASDCWGLHIRRTGLFMFGNTRKRSWLYKRFDTGWAFCTLGFHIFYRRRKPMTIRRTMIVPGDQQWLN